MTHITVEENGQSKVITDIAPIVAERDNVGSRLERFYEKFDQTRAHVLAPDEGMIVDLVNRYNELSDWIALFEAEKKRLENVRAGWELVKQIRAARL